MIAMLKKDRGFTLVELMVVILIIAILIAVAIPVFLGVRSRGYNSNAKQVLANAARAEAAVYAADNTYATAADMPNEEDSYQYEAAAQVAGDYVEPPMVGVVIAGGTCTLTTASENDADVGTIVITNGVIGSIAGL